jgi:hypothetical protein
MLEAAYGQHEDNLSQVSDVFAHLSSPDVMAAVYHRDPHRTSEWNLDLDTLFVRLPPT